MIAGVAFDLDKGLFTAAKLADLCGVKRPVIDTMGTRGFIQVTGREPPAAPRPQSKAKGRQPRSPKGHPLFSFRVVVKVREMRVLAAQTNLALTESVGMVDEEPGESAQRTIADYEASLSELADAPAYGGEWMWAMARSVERGKPFFVYAYAARPDDEWQIDMHIENPGVQSPNEPPCFGWKVPHIYVPVGEIFISVYNDCKRLLGLTAGEE
jgi:hypothetical protein